MSTHKNINRICVAAVVICILISFMFMNGEAFGIIPTVRATEYENRLFDTSKVHSIDIVINDWDTFLENCTSEEYSDCAVVIDGQSYKNVAIRAKGNTSLSNVSAMGSSRYSLKIEFDHYDKNKNYYGLDKLCLNNIIQDNTYMKDYLSYKLMNSFGVDTPLCSYVYITVNGEEWGLYLAVESVEDSFLERNYGSDCGELYKPDSMSFGGGVGNGKEFNFDDIKDKFQQNDGSTENGSSEQTQGKPDFSAMNDGSGMPDFPAMGDGSEMPDFPAMGDGSEMPDFPGMGDGSEMPDFPAMGDGKGGGGMPGGMGMGSDDVKLKYTDDSYDSYSNIFNNAKTDITNADKDRLISSLKSLSEYKDIENVVNVEEVIRYFVVHNFLLNGDSYTGSMIHNYYLYEKDGQLSMIPWDYNLAFGTFQAQNSDSQINSPIDTPVSGDMSDRPMVNWIFENEEYTELYHKYFTEFAESSNISEIIDQTAAMIDSYVQKDPTKFCEYDEFLTGVDTIRNFCELRLESVKGQLNNTIPSTSEGQSADNSAFIDASAITLSDMGSMNASMMGGGRQPKGDNSDSDESSNDSQMSQMPLGNVKAASGQTDSNENANAPQMGQMPQGGMQPPDGQMPQGGMQPPDGQMPQGGMQPPDGQMPQGDVQPPDGQMPQGDVQQSDSDSNSNTQQLSQVSENDKQSTDDQTDPDSSTDTQQMTQRDKQSLQEDNGNTQNNGDFNKPGFDNMHMPQDSAQQTGSNTTSWIFLGISAVLLGAGLVFAIKFKR